jgi:hypothetical protein
MVIRRNNRKKKQEKEENKKVKNATKVVKYGIHFKSKLEVTVYETLVKEGMNPKYEPTTFVLWRGFKPTAKVYDRKNKTESGSFHQETDKIIDIKYTPDFIFDYNGITVIIEAKGKVNETFPLKKKLFVSLLEKMSKTFYFVVRTKKETLEAINIIKNYTE